MDVDNVLEYGMEYRSLGTSDLQVSALSLGTATFGGTTEFFKAWGETDAREATRLLDIAIEAGVNLFDTADAYSNGQSEEILGHAIRGRRDKLLISTKASFRTGPGPDNVGSSRKHLIAACEGSLRRLGIDHIDLWQMHGFDSLTPIEETLRALEELVKSGKVRAIGCSNFSGWHLMKSLAYSDQHGLPRYVAHQAYYSLIARDLEWELMPLAMDQNVGTVVWSPLSGGQLSGKISRNNPPAANTRVGVQGARPGVSESQYFDIVDVMLEIGRETNRSASQVALNWVLQRPMVSTVIVGARNEQQLIDNLRAAEFKLDADQMHRLNKVSFREAVYPYWHQRRIFGERNPIHAELADADL
jgi:aryl-alcohol dehydrogenase-like predicted oxidoreductase